MATELSTDACSSPLSRSACWSQTGVVNRTLGLTCTLPLASYERLSLKTQKSGCSRCPRPCSRRGCIGEESQSSFQRGWGLNWELLAVLHPQDLGLPVAGRWR